MKNVKKIYLLIPIVIILIFGVWLVNVKISQDRLTEIMIETNEMNIVKAWQDNNPNYVLAFNIAYFEDPELIYSVSKDTIKSELLIIHSEEKQIVFNCYKMEGWEGKLISSIKNPTIQDIESSCGWKLENEN